MTFEIFKHLLETEIEKFFDAEIKMAPTAEFRLLLEQMSAMILRGGKRARPQLLFLTYMAYGGEEPESLIDICLALELHHQFLLMHDDIIDSDTVRYDGPNISGYFQQDGYADNLPESMALLAGDLAFTFAHQAVMNSEFYSEIEKLELLRAINEANAQACIGEQLDALGAGRPIADFSLDTLLQIQAFKCTSYSTKLPMRCAAILLQLDKIEINKIDAFATEFGYLFQMVDDHSDYFENDSAFNNRPKFRDYRQGTVTYPLFSGYEKSKKAQRDLLVLQIGNKNSSVNEMKIVVNILIENGGESASRKLVDTYYGRSGEALEKLAIDALYKKEFRKLLARFKV